jgi:hypothetical protein
VILPPKKNYIPQFLKQRDINSYCGHVVVEKMPRLRSVRSVKPRGKAALCGTETFAFFSLDPKKERHQSFSAHKFLC